MDSTRPEYFLWVKLDYQKENDRTNQQRKNGKRSLQKKKPNGIVAPIAPAINVQILLSPAEIKPAMAPPSKAWHSKLFDFP